MSTATGPVSSFRRPIISVPVALWVTLLAMTWVFFNVLLVSLGVRVGYPITCGLVAGGIDGGMLAWIAVATLSEKLHAGTAGLLSGYGFQDVLNDFKLTRQGVQWVHVRFDPLLDAVLGTGHEQLHQAIQVEVVRIACTAAFVVMAALIVQLIRTSWMKPH